MTFRVGQKVVCVDDSNQKHGLLNGDIYTIAAIGIYGGGLQVNLAEIVFPRAPDFQWKASRFRPIVERKTSIEIFTRMLNPSRVDA